MGERTETWVNIHQRQDGSRFMMQWTRSDDSMISALLNRSSRTRASLYRIHVRLKPEGAPKRYADDWDREAWESDPVFMRSPYAPRPEEARNAD